MLLRSHLPTLRASDRRGAILIVVISMLTIFAVVAITFVFYSAAEADAARIHKDSVALGDVGQPDPNEAVNSFLGALIYPTGDLNSNDLTNALRGHDLARGMYGWTGNGWTGTQPADNMNPFNGVGIFHETTTLPTAPDRARVVNHTAMSVSGTTYLFDPEWTGIRPLAVSPPYPATVPANTVLWMPTLASPGGRTYIPKNAPYTYPDANNLFLASISPQTGQVLVPSFYRSWQFNTGNSNPLTRLGPYDATHAERQFNTDWTSADGRAFILRPRPIDNTYNGTTEFPYVPANADGTFTGDVQNLTGGYFFDGTSFQARNDSLWMNVGLPPRKWNGKWVIPLIAPLIVDLDGRINLSAHGNRPAGGGNVGVHNSHAGYGPWEVNSTYVLQGENAAVVNARHNNGNPSLRNTTTTRLYNGGRRLPAHAKVNWSGTNGAAIQTPGQSGNNYTTSPTYPGTGYDDDVANAAAYQTGHPALFNPAEWAATNGSIRTFTPGDLRYLGGKYAADREFYQQADIAKLIAPYATPDISLIRGSIGTYASNTYRLDPVHRNRLSVTTLGATLDVPGNMPAGATTYPSLGGGTPPARFAGSTPGTFAGTSGIPITPVDLNRPLTDYRGDTTAPLSAANNTNAAQAQTDRQLLARDVFARLCIATGGTFTFDSANNRYSNGSTVRYYTATVGSFNAGDVEILAPAGAQYDALRGLAQLAVNIVDYIDNDDIMTPFAWNLAAPTEFVFGVEKPRLVINESYSEITNQWDEATMGTGMPPTQPAHVRFWVELMNPTSDAQPAALPPGSQVTPIGNGAVSFANSAYRIEIYRDAAGNVYNNLQLHNNVKGDPAVGAGVAPAARFVIPPASPSVNPNNGNYGMAGLGPTNGLVMVGPSLGAGAGPQPFEFNPAGLGVPPWTTMITSPAPAPLTPPPPGTPQDGMAYLLGTIPDETALNNGTYKRHVVVLQRLANPHAAYNAATNPYITVDAMDWVPSFDAVNRTPAETMAPRTAKAGGALPGYDPASSRFAVGKVQPYAGRAHATLPGATPMYPTYSFTSSPKSFVLRQNPTGYDTTSPNNPRHTFGRHNGLSTTGPGASGLPTTASETLMSPFDMLLHLDRPLANQMELLHVLAVKPHLVTQEFVRDQPAGTLRKDLAYAPWLGATGPGIVATEVPGYDTANNRTNNQLYRALDLLRVRPWTAGAAMGGKVHGRININTVQDSRVLQALFDPQAGNGFNGAFVSNTAWGNWIGSRTPMSTLQMIDPTQPSGIIGETVPVPSMFGTVEENPTGGGQDRPFKPFGVGELNAGTYTGASGLQDTILRTDTTTGVPRLWDTTQAHPYQQAEALRKVLNNVTTTSNTFMVIFTVGYFEARLDANGNPVYAVEGNHFVTAPPALPAPQPATAEIRRWILGKEAYRETPGDLRQQFVAMIDRNNIAVHPTSLSSASRPMHTMMEANANLGANTITIAAVPGTTDPVGAYPLPVSDCALYSDGVGVQILPSSATNTTYLVLGTGADQTVVQIQSTAVNPNPIQKLGTGLYRIELSAPLTRSYPASTLVSTARYGNPGPQLGSFDITDPKNNTYRHVVPYWARTR